MMLAINSHPQDKDERMHPSATWQCSANLTKEKAQALYTAASEDYEGFWKYLAETTLDWETPFTQTYNTRLDPLTQAPTHEWFLEGTLSIYWHCVARHAQNTPDKIAFYWQGEDGDKRHITYQDFDTLVKTLAQGLNACGLETGERVVLYMPTCIEAIAMMHACAKEGLIHTVVFAGFSAQSLADRIIDTQASLVVTANVQCRQGKASSLKTIVDEALALAHTQGHDVPRVIIYPRTHDSYPQTNGRDMTWETFLTLGQETPLSHHYKAFPSEQPLFILYTSGSTGKPKGLWHSSAGYLLWSILTMTWVMDAKAETDVFWCTADIGWITGHTYVAYGPMALGMTQLIVEGTPHYPHASRWFECIETYEVTQFYTAPTAIRAFMKLDETLPDAYAMKSLRLLGSVGEAINPEAWQWLYDRVGKSRCPVVDTWWQTETGGHMMAPLPGISSLKPGSCGKPLPGIQIACIPEAALSPKHLETGSLTLKTEPKAEGGTLVIQRPWPSMARGIWGDTLRFRQSYYPFSHLPHTYLAGDACRVDLEGDFWMMGRLDDVMNVSGHRLGTMEIESALASHPEVAEAAVIGIPHPVKGEAIIAFVVCKTQTSQTPQASMSHPERYRQWVSDVISPIAKPERCYIVPALPKTRSGKVMRRILKALAQGQSVAHLPQDLSTLENPAMLSAIASQMEDPTPPHMLPKH
ncbi:MAG: acetate--CoA ligase [Vampirovibrionales bacterium]